MNDWQKQIAEFLGSTHRPLTILIAAISFAWALVNRIGAGELAVAAALVGTLYTGKVWENNVQAKADAEVKKAGG